MSTKIKSFLIESLILLIVLGCAHVNYVGKSYSPTNEIEIYYSEKEIQQDYHVIGHAIGSGTLFVSNEKIQKKLIEEAMKKGADALLITEIDKDNISTGDGSIDEKQIKASFIKFQPAEVSSKM